MDVEGDDDSSSEYNSSDFEEVPADDNVDDFKPSATGITITVPHDGLQITGRSRRKDDMEAIIRREMNRQIREYQEDLHKVSLLCLIGVGLAYNTVLRSESVLSLALSTLPSQHSYPPQHLDLSYMEMFLKWFRKIFKAEIVAAIPENDLMLPAEMEGKLTEQLQKKEAKSYNYLVCLFVVILRSLGVDARLVWSLKPCTLKPDSKDLMKDPDRKSTGAKVVSTPIIEDASKSDPRPSTSGSSKSSTSVTNGKRAPGPSGGWEERSTRKMPSSDTTEDEELSASSGSNDEYHFVPTRKRKKPVVLKKEPPPAKPTKKCQPPKKLKMGAKKERGSVMDSNPTSPAVKVKLQYDFWAEVYLEEEERWISVDLTTGSVLCDSTLEAKATPSVDYVLAFGNQGYLKDVTRRYATQWLTAAQRRRVDSDWWNQSLKPFVGPMTAKERDEDESLDQQIINLPIPKTVQELKGHPLYALRRHLLKFEIIYPETATPIGYVNKEPIYPRSCVKTLHTRELWMRQAKAIRRDEVPSKIVKSRPKYDKNLGRLRNDNPPLELFGEWQTEDYIPMPAVNGKIPRNDYGNVELFQEKMLPGGTVHLRVPGLQRLARKLDIDCARAVTGFEYHSGSCHPTFDGFIVCEEFKDILLDAYNQELAEGKGNVEGIEPAAQEASDKKDEKPPERQKAKPSLSQRLRVMTKNSKKK